MKMSGRIVQKEEQQVQMPWGSNIFDVFEKA